MEKRAANICENIFTAQQTTNKVNQRKAQRRYYNTKHKSNLIDLRFRDMFSVENLRFRDGGYAMVEQTLLWRKQYSKLLEWKQNYAPEYTLFIKGARRVGGRLAE